VAPGELQVSPTAAVQFAPAGTGPAPPTGTAAAGTGVGGAAGTGVVRQPTESKTVRIKPINTIARIRTGAFIDLVFSFIELSFYDCVFIESHCILG